MAPLSSIFKASILFKECGRPPLSSAKEDRRVRIVLHCTVLHCIKLYYIIYDCKVVLWCSTVACYVIT